MKVFFRAFLPLWAAIGLLGCSSGSKFTGYVPPGGGTPPSPNITTITPDALIQGSAAFTLTVRGNNFASNSVIYLNNSAVTTTYVSSLELQAQIQASVVANAGTDTINVFTPNIGLSNGVPLQIVSSNGFTVSQVAIQAHDMVWNPATQLLYLSVLSTNGTDPSSIATLNPATGQLGTSQALANQPHRLAISADDTYLYAGIDGHGVQRFALPGLTPDITIALATGLNNTPYDATTLKVAPGNSHALAVAQGNFNGVPEGTGGVVIYDDAVPRPQSVAGPDNHSTVTVGSMRWGADDSHLYGENNEGGSNDLYVFAVNANGVQLAQDYPGAFTSTYTAGETPSIPQVKLHYDAASGDLFNDGGLVVNPATGTAVASFQTYGRLALDDTLHVAFFFGQTFAQSGGPDYSVSAYDLTTNKLISSIVIPSVAGTPVKMVRWGTNGLAVLTNNDNATPSTPVPGMGVYLIQGAFVSDPASLARTSPATSHWTAN